MKSFKQNVCVKFISVFTAVTFIVTSVAPAQAQSVLNLPAPGTMVHPTTGYVPAIIKGLTIDTQNPFHFDFIVDSGDSGLGAQTLKPEAEKLVKYFLAALTVPEDQKWVNLSPYEKDRIIPDALGTTDMGRDMLAQDYMLKQLTASMMYPDDELGKKFWERVYAKAQQMYGTTDIPMNTFNKIWIVPSKATVYEYENSAFVVERHLKVYLEKDYVALQRSLGVSDFGLEGIKEDDADAVNASTSDIVRDVLLPEIEKEVNEGQIFANLRQIYNAMILATWYRRTLKDSLLGQIYANQNKTAGIENNDPDVKNKIYQQYLEAFKKGAYDLLREDYDAAKNAMVIRKYFSGGTKYIPGNVGFQTVTNPGDVAQAMLAIDRAPESKTFVVNAAMLDSRAPKVEANKAMLTPFEQLERDINAGLFGLSSDTYVQVWFENDPQNRKMFAGKLDSLDQLKSDIGKKGETVSDIWVSKGNDFQRRYTFMPTSEEVAAFVREYDFSLKHVDFNISVARMDNKVFEINFIHPYNKSDWLERVNGEKIRQAVAVYAEEHQIKAAVTFQEPTAVERVYNRPSFYKNFQSFQARIVLEILRDIQHLIVPARILKDDTAGTFLLASLGEDERTIDLLQAFIDKFNERNPDQKIQRIQLNKPVKGETRQGLQFESPENNIAVNLTRVAEEFKNWLRMEAEGIRAVSEEHDYGVSRFANAGAEGWFFYTAESTETGRTLIRKYADTDNTIDEFSEDLNNRWETPGNVVAEINEADGWGVSRTKYPSVENRAMLGVATGEVTAKVGDVKQLVRQAISQGKFVVIANTNDFALSNGPVINAMNSGYDVMALKFGRSVLSEFLFDGHPKAIGFSRADLESVGISVPENGIILQADEQTKQKITALRDKINLNTMQGVRQLNEKKNAFLGPNRAKQTIPGLAIFDETDTLWKHSHIFDVTIKHRTTGETQVVRTFKQSPIVTDEYDIFPGPETIKKWKEILESEDPNTSIKTVIVLGRDVPINEILGNIVQQKLVINVEDPQAIKELNDPLAWEQPLEAHYQKMIEQEVLSSMERSDLNLTNFRQNFPRMLFHNLSVSEGNRNVLLDRHQWTNEDNLDDVYHKLGFANDQLFLQITAKSTFEESQYDDLYGRSSVVIRIYFNDDFTISRVKTDDKLTGDQDFEMRNIREAIEWFANEVRQFNSGNTKVSNAMLATDFIKFDPAKHKVLIVEDESADALKAFLGRLGISFVEAGSAEQALQILQERSDEIGLIFSDINMSGMNGLELLKAVSQDPAFNRISFYFQTGNNKVKGDFPSNYRGFLPKPIDPDDVAQIIKEVSGDKAMLNEEEIRLTGIMQSLLGDNAPWFEQQLNRFDTANPEDRGSIEAGITSIIDQMNVFDAIPVDRLEPMIKVNNQDEFLASQNASPYIAKSKQAYLGGKYIPQFLFAGNATRLKMGAMYPIDVWTVAQKIRNGEIDKDALVNQFGLVDGVVGSYERKLAAMGAIGLNLKDVILGKAESIKARPGFIGWRLGPHILFINLAAAIKFARNKNKISALAEDMKQKANEALDKFIAEIKAISEEKFARFSYGMGPRQIIAYKLFLKKLANQEKQNFNEVMGRQKVILHTNDDNHQMVLDDFIKNHFYGFKKENVFFIRQPAFNGFTIENGEAVMDRDSNHWVYGHGYNLMQLHQQGQVIQLNAENQPVVVQTSVLDLLPEDGFIGSHRINDETKWISAEVADVEKLAFSMHLMDQGLANMAVELVENPGKQKGGNAVLDTQTKKGALYETLATKANKGLDARLTEAGKQGAPYNAFRLTYNIRELKKVLESNLRFYLAFKTYKKDGAVRGRLILDSVTGDVTQMEDAHAEFYTKPGTLIHDFKQIGNLPEALRYLIQQDDELADNPDILSDFVDNASLQEKTLFDRNFEDGSVRITELPLPDATGMSSQGDKSTYVRGELTIGDDTYLFSPDQTMVEAVQMTDFKFATDVLTFIGPYGFRVNDFDFEKLKTFLRLEDAVNQKIKAIGAIVPNDFESILNDQALDLAKDAAKQRAIQETQDAEQAQKAVERQNEARKLNLVLKLNRVLGENKLYSQIDFSKSEEQVSPGARELLRTARGGVILKQMANLKLNEGIVKAVYWNAVRPKVSDGRTVVLTQKKSRSGFVNAVNAQVADFEEANAAQTRSFGAASVTFREQMGNLSSVISIKGNPALFKGIIGLLIANGFNFNDSGIKENDYVLSAVSETPVNNAQLAQRTRAGAIKLANISRVLKVNDEIYPASVPGQTGQFYRVTQAGKNPKVILMNTPDAQEQDLRAIFENQITNEQNKVWYFWTLAEDVEARAKAKEGQGVEEEEDDAQLVGSKSDAAMNATRPGVVQKKREYGGINLNDAMLDLSIKRDGKGIILPVSNQPIEELKKNIPGFTPMIIDIRPIASMPQFLSELGKTGANSGTASADPSAGDDLSLGPMDRKIGRL